MNTGGTKTVSARQSVIQQSLGLAACMVVLCRECIMCPVSSILQCDLGCLT